MPRARSPVKDPKGKRSSGFRWTGEGFAFVFTCARARAVQQSAYALFCCCFFFGFLLVSSDFPRIFCRLPRNRRRRNENEIQILGNLFSGFVRPYKTPLTSLKTFSSAITFFSPSRSFVKLNLNFDYCSCCFLFSFGFFFSYRLIVPRSRVIVAWRCYLFTRLPAAGKQTHTLLLAN